MFLSRLVDLHATHALFIKFGNLDLGSPRLRFRKGTNSMAAAQAPSTLRPIYPDRFRKGTNSVSDSCIGLLSRIPIGSLIYLVVVMMKQKCRNKYKKRQDRE